MAHIPTTHSFNFHKYFVLLLESVEIETADTNLITLHEPGIYMFASKDAGQTFERVANSLTDNPIAKFFAKQKDENHD